MKFRTVAGIAIMLLWLPIPLYLGWLYASAFWNIDYTSAPWWGRPAIMLLAIGSIWLATTPVLAVRRLIRG